MNIYYLDIEDVFIKMIDKFSAEELMLTQFQKEGSIFDIVCKDYATELVLKMIDKFGSKIKMCSENNIKLLINLIMGGRELRASKIVKKWLFKSLSFKRRIGRNIIIDTVLNIACKGNMEMLVIQIIKKYPTEKLKLKFVDSAGRTFLDNICNMKMNRALVLLVSKYTDIELGLDL